MRDINRLNIAVTGINATDNPGPGSGVIRGIRFNENYSGKIIGLAYDTMDPGIFQKELADVVYMIPYPSEDPNILFERIRAINEEENIDILIPTLDAELLSFINIEDKLLELGIKMFLPTAESFKMRSKNILSDFCLKNGISAPKTISVSSVEEIHKMELSYPVYVKGIFYDAHIAYSFSEASQAFHTIRAKWGVPIIIQEYVAGEEFDIVALGDGEGGTIGAIPMKKMSLTEKKKAWAGISIKNEKLIQMTKDLIKALKWCGPMEAEIIVNPKTDEYYLIEINPRFPAWCILAPWSGQNLQFSLVELAAGKKVEPFEDYEAGKLFIRYSIETLADIKDIESLVLKGFLKR